MKQLIKTTSGVTASSLIREAPRADEILLACLQGMETVSAHLHSVLAKKPAKGTQRTDPPASHPQILLKIKFTHVIKQFFKVRSEVLFRQRAGLTKIARLKETGSGATTALKSTDGSHLPLECEPVETENHVANELVWMPLIKASTGSAIPVQAPIAASVTDCNACDEKQTGHYDGFELAGREILCVGGRANLYLEYRRLIETAGGNLLIYRGGLQNSQDLSTLLTRADMVVCPVDCVNHHTYFTVKRYCKYSGKVCVLLDRSCLPTFRKGVETLAALAASSAEATCSGV